MSDNKFNPEDYIVGLPGSWFLAKCPQCLSDSMAIHGEGYMNDEMRLHSVIMCLNDIHKWHRDKIADWLESLDIDLEFKEKHVASEDSTRL